MLKGLAYQVTFASTGKSINTILAPEQVGTTLITGKNEAGKSLNLEMFAFTLFGSEALRGKMTDYKTLKASSEFMVKGETYEVERTKKDSKLSCKGVVLAQGTSPVNLRIKEILGFGLEVFKVSNWCAQGEIQRLSKMKPTERRQMIDEVSGLTQLDGVIAWVKDYVKELKVRANTKAESLVKPTKPTIPEDLLPKEELTSRIKIRQAKQLERASLSAKLENAPIEPLKPVEPTLVLKPVQPTQMPYPAPPVAPENYEKFGWNEVAERNCSAFIEAMPEWTKQLETTEQVLENTRSRKPTYVGEYTREQLKLIEEAQKISDDMRQQQQQKALLENKGTVSCPNCNHEHYIASELLKSYPKTFDFPRVELTPDKVEQALKYIVWEEETKRLEAQVEELVEGRPMPAEDFAQYLKFYTSRRDFNLRVESFNHANGEYQKHCQAIDEKFLGDSSTWKSACKAVDDQNTTASQRYTLELDLYAKALKAFEEATTLYNDNVDALAELPLAEVLSQEISTLEQGLDQWKHYDFSMTRYTEDLSKYDEGFAEYEALANSQKNYELAGKALKEVKIRVKGYLVPSLSKVASQLLNEMTGGERCSVKISEDFEIEVDGQMVQTLSGSGQDIANLAIRIALGQVLTHKVMPLMMFDEIDAAMDDTRASFTWECIQKVASRIGQVLLVSHKDLSSTHTIKI